MKPSQLDSSDASLLWLATVGILKNGVADTKLPLWSNKLAAIDKVAKFEINFILLDSYSKREREREKKEKI